ncbi:MAG: hypothetical protein ACTSYB_16735 [Candidatus Helarchaeota archaeon]
MVEVNDPKIDQVIALPGLEELPQAEKLELAELDDLLQMVVSINNTDLSLYYLKKNGEHLYLVWIVIHDFYTLNGLPLVIFVRTDIEPNRFIKYRPDTGTIDFVDKIQESSAAYIKIIKIKQLPFCLDLTF